MSNIQRQSHLTARRPNRIVLAISFCASMVAFGCTTDRTVGNGDPVVTPGLRTSPTGGLSTGSESAPPVSLNSRPALQQPVALVSAEEAAAIMAQHQPRVRVLGPSSPDGGGRPYTSGRIVAARGRANNGAAGVGTDAAMAADFFADSGIAAIDASSVSGSTSVSASSIATPSPTVAGSPNGLASVTTLSPTAASVINPPAGISGSPSATAASSQRTAAPTVSAQQAGTSGTESGNQIVGAPTTLSANSVRVSNTSGKVVVTNATATAAGKQQ